MNVLKVYEYGEEVLRKKATPIKEITDEIKNLAKDMILTCHAQNGVGLAAPQVGHSIRMFVLSIPPEDESTDNRKNFFEEVFINPIIVRKTGKDKAEEGCLSVPGEYAVVERAKYITVKYQNLDGEDKMIEGAGLLARALQHENDHLDGILFVDRLGSLKKDLIKKQLDRKYGLD